jgi:hypothetical protein
MIASALALSALPALAQLQLPGAVTPSGEGAVVTPAGPPKPKRTGPPPPPKVPADDLIVGRTLERNGRAGVMQFAKEGKDIRLSRLTLPGEKISNPAAACSVEVAGAPFTPAVQGRPRGVTRYAITAGDCTIDFDVLEGAVLVPQGSKVCTFASNDCRADPSGLWGQPANEIGAARTKEIEHQRGAIERTMREHFRTWIEAAGKDRDLVRRISREQAGFSSTRSEICDGYAREADHGYCALVLTQARSIALAARVPPPEMPPPEADPFAAKKKKR